MSFDVLDPAQVACRLTHQPETFSREDHHLFMSAVGAYMVMKNTSADLRNSNPLNFMIRKRLRRLIEIETAVFETYCSALAITCYITVTYELPEYIYHAGVPSMVTRNPREIWAENIADYWRSGYHK